MNRRQTFSLLLRHTRAELRGGIKGFRLFLLCLVLGVGAFATILATVTVLSRSLESNAAMILGGDVEVRQIHTEIEQADLSKLKAQTKALSHVSLLRTMARTTALGEEGQNKEGRSLLVEAKAVDEYYPLVGGVVLQGGKTVSPQEMATLLEKRDGVWGAVVAPIFVAKSLPETEAAEGTKKGVGRRFVLGGLPFEVRAVLERESDSLSASLFPLGARVLLSQRGLQATGLRVPGSLIYENYRMLLHPGQSIENFHEFVRKNFPNAAWTSADKRDAAPRVRQIIDRLSLFMTLAALAGLFAGGAGIANGLTALFGTRRIDMALWKTLGASSRYIRLLLGAQTAVMGSVGIVIGCAIGVAVSLVLAPWVGSRFALPVDVFVPFEALVRSAGVGFCILILFSLKPFLDIDRVPPSLLLRGIGASATQGEVAGGGLKGSVGQASFGLPFGLSFGPSLRLFLLGFPVFLLLCGLTVWGSSSPIFTLSMLLSLLLSLWMFPLASRGALSFARWLRARTRLRSPILDNALRQTRSSALLSIVLPLGLGLSLFVALAEIELSLTRDAETGLSEQAPRQFFLDLQPNQLEPFRSALQSEGVRLEDAPMLRGKILAFNGIKADALEVSDDNAWVLEGDRGITFSDTPPKNAIIAEGEWWGAGEQDELLLSFDEDVARAFGLTIGDTVRISVLGQVLEAKIANLRKIDWETWQINFMMILSPHPSLRDLPFTLLGAGFAAEDSDAQVEEMVAQNFPNVTMLRIGDFVSIIKALLEGMTHAVRAVSALTLAVGTVVLSSAIVVEQRRRVYEAVVMKTLGISRRKILLSFFAEYLLVGGSVALLSVVLGGIFGWAVLRFAMNAQNIVFSISVSLAIVVGVFLLSAICSGISGVLVLSRSSWSVLRNP